MWQPKQKFHQSTEDTGRRINEIVHLTYIVHANIHILSHSSSPEGSVKMG